MTRAPKRLLDSAELTGSARRLLELGRTQAPVIYDTTAGAARFSAALARAATNPPLAAARLAKVLPVGAKLGKLCLLFSPALVGAVVMFGPMRSEPELARSPLPAASPTQIFPEVPAPADRNTRPLPPEPFAQAGVGASSVPPLIAAESAVSRASIRPQAPDAVGGDVAPRTLRPDSAQRSSAERSSKAVGGASRSARGRIKTTDSASRTAAATTGSRSGDSSPKDASSSRGPAASKPASASGQGLGAAEAKAPTDAPRGRRANPEGAETAVPRTTDSIGELEGLARARLLARREPLAALQLLERLALAHPRGYFVEERAALYVIALAEAGQSDRAAQLAAAFLRNYPASPLADSVRIAVQR